MFCRKLQTKCSAFIPILAYDTLTSSFSLSKLLFVSGLLASTSLIFSVFLNHIANVFSYVISLSRRVHDFLFEINSLDFCFDYFIQHCKRSCFMVLQCEYSFAKRNFSRRCSYNFSTADNYHFFRIASVFLNS